MTECAFGRRGNQTVEWCKFNDEPQVYCHGWIDDYTDEIPEECRNCAKHVLNAERDYKEYLAGVVAGNCKDGE